MATPPLRFEIQDSHHLQNLFWTSSHEPKGQWTPHLVGNVGATCKSKIAKIIIPPAYIVCRRGIYFCWFHLSTRLSISLFVCPSFCRARGQNLGCLIKIVYCSLFIQTTSSPWPLFHGPVILPYILNFIWCINIIIWDYESVWSDIWPISKCSQCELYFMVQWFLYYLLKTTCCMTIIVWDYESVWDSIIPQK